MWKRFQIALAVSLIGAGSASIWQARRSRGHEPVYNGKPIGYWINYLGPTTGCRRGRGHHARRPRLRAPLAVGVISESFSPAEASAAIVSRRSDRLQFLLGQEIGEPYSSSLQVDHFDCHGGRSILRIVLMANNRLITDPRRPTDPFGA
jgi:hypothetical protein